jgi:hypothetical protein
MHAQRDLRLPGIPAEVPLPHQEADEKARVEVGDCRFAPSVSPVDLFTK